MRGRARCTPVPSMSGERMRLIGWAIALAAAALTPAAAAQAPASSPTTAQTSAATPAAAQPNAATPPAGTAQYPNKPDVGTAPPGAPAGVGVMAPTPGIGEPDGSKGIQPQVTPIGEEAASFHNNWLLPLCG